MKINELIGQLVTRRNGSWIKILYKKEIPFTDGSNGYVEKTMYIRKGIKYNAQKQVKESGKTPTHELPWGEWEIANLIISHKGKYYLRAYSTPIKAKSKFFVDGREVKYDDLVTMPIKKEFFKKCDEKPAAMTLNIENIMEICPTK